VFASAATDHKYFHAVATIVVARENFNHARAYSRVQRNLLDEFTGAHANNFAHSLAPRGDSC
jgi:hypothetical protein